ncbi:MAG: zinc ribbon domain-containing protein [Pyrinomonadaceae bacterium]|nr:zinc ribbon domain-containing protein [Pyrinomonadaceae bacterium]
MFCPSCGIDDLSANQFCRSCGADLRSVRTALESPDQITASAVTARAEIGAAVAARIREIRTAAELSTVTEEVLPQIEKFLESPTERRLRRMRVGTILASIGLGAAVAMSVVSMAKGEEDLLFLAGLGLVAFFIGLGFILNGIFLTVPRQDARDGSSDADAQRMLDSDVSDLRLPATPARNLFSSVTEHTTKHLKGKEKT